MLCGCFFSLRNVMWPFFPVRITANSLKHFFWINYFVCNYLHKSAMLFLCGSLIFLFLRPREDLDLMHNRWMDLRVGVNAYHSV